MMRSSDRRQLILSDFYRLAAFKLIHELVDPHIMIRVEIILLSCTACLFSGFENACVYVEAFTDFLGKANRVKYRLSHKTIGRD